MPKKNLVRFNVQNVKYALESDAGFGSPVAYGTAMSMALENVVNTKQIYGDGNIIGRIVNNSQMTGTLGVNNISDAYEIAMGRSMQLSQGLATAQELKKVSHAIYFEVKELHDDNTVTVVKTWIFNVTSDRPSETYNQNTDNINESSFEIPLTIGGIVLKNSDGSVHKDTDGNEVRIWKLTSKAGDANFDTFGDAVVIPTADDVSA
jgi:hypothetical protein